MLIIFQHKDDWSHRRQPKKTEKKHNNQKPTKHVFFKSVKRAIPFNQKSNQKPYFFANLLKQNSSFQNQPKKQAFPKGWNCFQGHRCRIFGEAPRRRHIRPTLWRPRAARRERRPRRRWGGWRRAQVGMTKVDEFGGGFPDISDPPDAQKKKA